MKQPNKNTPETFTDSDRVAKEKAKTYADLKVRQHVIIQPDDTVLVKQRRTNKLSSSFSPNPLTVTSVKGRMITARRSDGSMVTRDQSHFRKISARSLAVPEDNNEEDFDIPAPVTIQPIPAAPDPELAPLRPRRIIHRPQRLIEQL
jgi:hypothetical protein